MKNTLKSIAVSVMLLGFVVAMSPAQKSYAALRADAQYCIVIPDVPHDYTESGKYRAKDLSLIHI